MIEIFDNIPIEIKKLIMQYIDYVFENYRPQEIAQIINDFVKSCTIQEQSEFIDFYFHLKLEQMKDESNSNISEESAR